MPAARTDHQVRSAQQSSTERDLAESIERYRSLFAYSPHAAFSLDLEGNFIDANVVSAEVSGYSLEEFLRMNFTDVIAPEHLPASVAAFEGALHREPQQLEANMRHKDGSVIELRVTAVPVVVCGEVVGVHGLAEDVTEQNELRRELERTRRAAEEASAAKTLFLANMSHEVRTPLTSVLGATEILAEGDLSPGDRALVAIVQRNAEKLHRLVNDILDVSRLEAGKLDVQETVISLQEVAADAITWAGPLAYKEGLTFTWDLDTTLPTHVYGDAMRISQVLTNLLGNAMKFTDQGEVRLGVHTSKVRDRVTDVRFTVEDSGIGIPTEQMSAVFESFTQADTSTTRKYGGAGLGLAISQELVHLMGGVFEASSVEGVGSTFSFTLPLEIAPHGST
ncbi:HAMP domain-containing sensor histidine kinase [Marmoricola sp. URHB0036]|uniref:sensor histidine kinase n=1 Tax=Marmoricola sp. URHB0036 TaxID=1298863 RepID=UPI000419B459|nr:ATP-binding protein [Marmoricola sp. URHB0036]